MVSMCQQLRSHFNLSAVGSVVLGVQTTELLRKLDRFNLMLVYRKLTIQYFWPSIEHEFELWKISSRDLHLERFVPFVLR